MRVRLLGTAAGGGFPQWNCNCVNCRSVRAGLHGARPRTQSCAAVSADGSGWFLLNASPDVRQQIEAFPPLLPPIGAQRGTGIEGVLVTNADLDHTLGLFILREGRPLSIHATPTVRDTLAEGLALERVMDCYCGVEWHAPPSQLRPLLRADGTSSGLRYAALSLAGKPPRYREQGVRRWALGVKDPMEEGVERLAFSVKDPTEAANREEGRGKREEKHPTPNAQRLTPAGTDDGVDGHCVGYEIVDETTGGRLIFLPDVAQLDEIVMARVRDCDVLLLDGTFWSEEEMQTQGVGATPAARMGHLPVGGQDGSLARIAPLAGPRRIYVHINNTNPMLLTDSPERAAVEAAGCEVGDDGLELQL